MSAGARPTAAPATTTLALRLAAAALTAAAALAAPPALAQKTTSGAALKGTYVEVGVSNAGYFGLSLAEVTALGGYHAGATHNVNGLGFIADYRKNGWVTQWGGDYFTPGTPYEGFSVDFTGAAARAFSSYNGLGTTFTNTSLTYATTGSARTATWTGDAVSGNEKLRIIQTYAVGADNVFFTANVQVINVGTVALNSVRFARSVDPDNDQSWAGSYSTLNRVVYQTPNAQNQVCVTATGTFVPDMVLGLGAIDPRAVVRYGYVLNTTAIATMLAGSASGSATADRAMGIIFNLGTLNPGQSTSFDYAYILSAADLSVALGSLAAITTLQPTGLVSGTVVPFQVKTNDMGRTSQVDFYLNGVLVGTSTSQVGGAFATTFDSTAYPNGNLTLRAVATINGVQVEKSSTVVVDNSGPPIAITAPTAGQAVTGDGLTASVVGTNPANPPVSVTFYREYNGATVLLGTDTTAPFSATYNTSDLGTGGIVAIRAYAVNAAGATTTAVVSFFATSGTAITATPGTTPYLAPGGAVVVDPAVAVLSPSNLTQATVAITSGFAPGQDVLSFTPQGGVTGAYDPSTGILALNGSASAAVYQAVLRSVTYTNGSGAPSVGRRQITFSLGSGLYYPGSGHFYEFVPSAAVTWGSARTAAAARTYFGLQGYLATITSAGENAFVGTKVQADGWIGASTPSTTFPRTWSWVTGPESGAAFFSNTGPGAGAVLNGLYANWDLPEPNSFGGNETVAQFYAGTSTWNDLSTTATQGGYLVEYGGMAGDPTLLLSGSRELQVTASTTTTVTSSAAPSVWGQPVTFTATVSPAGAGTVQFRIDGVAFGAPVTLVGGVATSGATAALAVGDHAVTAAYSGDGSYIASTSAPYTQTVGRAATAITVISSNAAPVYPAAVTLTATVTVTAPGVGTPTGTVDFTVNGAPIAGCTGRALSAVAPFVATCPNVVLPGGIDAVRATYAGDASFQPAGPALTVVTVAQAAPAVSLSTSTTPTAFGQPVLLTATVPAVGAGATPTGTVDFLDGGVVIPGCALQPLVGTTATCAVSTLAVGVHALTLRYGGDVNYGPVTGGAVVQTVFRAATNIALAADPAAPTYPTPVTLTATVSVVAPGAGTPTGAVDFTANGTLIAGCGSRPLSAGAPFVATCTAVLPGGASTAGATYSGSPSFAAAGPATAMVTVARADVTPAVASGFNPSVTGAPVTLTATVPPAGAGALPTGRVAFLADGAELAGCTAVDLSAGAASCAVSALAVGDHAITVRYDGDGNYQAAFGGALTQTVQRASTALDLASSSGAVTYPAAVTLSATVSVVAPGGGVPTGTVSFSADGAPIAGCAAVPLSAAAPFQASCPGVVLGGGLHGLQASYTGDGSFVGSGPATAAVAVAPASAAPALAASANPSVFGQPVTYTATIPAAGAGAVPTGSVDFLEDGAPIAGCTAVPLGNGSAACTAAALNVATHAITIQYGGDANYAAAQGGPLAQVVDRGPTAVTLGASPATVVHGEAPLLTAEVVAVAPAAGTPGGSVQFLDGALVLATVPLVGGSASYLPVLPAGGPHAYRAVYLGSATYAGASSAVGPVTVTPAAPSLALGLAAGGAPSEWLEPVTLVGSVSGAGLLPGGTVTFLDGLQPIPGCAALPLLLGQATCDTATLAVGDHVIDLSYSGDGSYAPAGPEGALAHAVVPAATSIALDASAAEQPYGEPLTLTATVAAVGPGGGIPLGAVTFGDGATTFCADVPLDAAGQASCALPADLPLGPYDLTAVFTGSADHAVSASDPLPRSVVQGPAVLALAVSASRPVFSQELLLTASAGGGGLAPTGVVAITVDGALLCEVALVDGSASCAAPLLPVGAHLVQADYLGDDAYLPASAEPLPLDVGSATTTTALAVTPADPTYGVMLVLRAAVAVDAPATTPPLGEVVFSDGGRPLATVPVDPATGLAALTVPLPDVGPHQYQAWFTGSAETSGSVAADQPVTVGQATPSVTLVQSAGGAPAAYGEPVSFTAAVTGGAGLPPGGTVTFLADGAPIPGCALLDLAAGPVTCTLASLPPGAHAIAAAYTGDAQYLGGVTAGPQLLVGAAATAVALAASVNPAAFGEPVVLDVAVTALPPSTFVPAGTVELLDGAEVIATAPLAADGTARFTVAALAVGGHALTARLVGDPAFAAASSAPLPLLVARAASATAVASSLPLSTFGDAVTFTATVAAVAPGAGVPEGTVEFLDGAQLLGTGALSGGVATFTTATLGAGAHQVTARYLGDPAAFEPSASADPVAQLVERAASAVLLAAAPSPSVFGQEVAFSAAVSAGPGVPSGLVVFEEGGVELARVAADAAGLAVFGTAALPVGSHLVVARYLGADDYLPSASAPVAQPVELAPTAVALAASPAPSRFGQPVTLTATVAVPPPGAGTPTGLVTFFDRGQPIGTAPLGPDGRAVLELASLSAAIHDLTAAYAGDAGFAPSASPAGALLHEVQPGATAVALSASVAPSRFGEPVTFTVAVTAVAPAAGTPSGTVTVSENGTVLATLTLVDGGASATLADLPVGSHALTASYAGDGSFLAQDGQLVQEVAQARTATSLAASVNPSVRGQPVSWTATVAITGPGAGLRTGTVAFRDGALLLATVPVAADGTATLTSAELPAGPLGAGSHPLTATYSGDAGFAGSAGALTQLVGQGATTVAVASSPAPSMFGQQVTITATVAPVAPASGVPGGQVTFRDGATALGTASLDGAGRASLQLSSLAAGSHTLHAEYGGAADFAAAAGSGPHLVAQGAATVAVESSRSPSRRGRPVVFTATVTSPHATPTGTVTFRSGETVLGTGTLVDGVARLTVRSLVKQATPWPITVEYAGAADFAGATGQLAGGQVVENSPPVAGAGTALALGPAGASGATVRADGAFDGPALTVEGWVKVGWSTPAEAPGAAPTVLSLGDAGAARLAVGVKPDRSALVVTWAGASRDVPAPLDDQGWHHLALVQQDGALAVYLDGGLADTLQGTPAGAGAELRLGADFAGELDELRIWTVARPPAALLADLRRPLAGDEAGLAGYWRMDEGAGVELFDGSPGQRDGAVALAAPGAAPFAPSAAWRHREVKQERPMAPADAGYDLDGDPLTLAIAAAPQHGAASTDPAALQVGYLPAPRFLGTDGLTFALDDGSGPVAYELDLEVTRILLCQASADCGGGDLCVQGLCASPADLAGASGGCGCTTAGGGALGLWALVALGLTRRRSRRPGGPA